MFPQGDGLPTDYAQQFSTGSLSYTLTDVKADVLGVDGFGDGTAYLLSDNGGSPGSRLATLFFPPVPTNNAYSVLTFTPTSSVTMAAGTNYWFALGNRESLVLSGELDWANTASGTNSGPGSLGLAASSVDKGATWRTVAFPLNRTKIEVDGTPRTTAAVPEPSTALMAAAGMLAGVAVWARRRRRQG
jgi:hypothetical protein